MKTEEKKVARQLVESSLAEQGFELADLVLSEYKTQVTVKVLLYGPDGVNLDQCAQVSRDLGDKIDGTDLFKGGYTLEVSSPGLDRPLKTALDYKYRVGENVKIQFVDTGRKKVRGLIRSADETSVALESDDGMITIDLADIEQAQIIF